MRALRSSRLLWRSGFTLIELLSVIGVIVVLAGLLLPALAKGKARAWTLICLNNKRQLGLAWVLYAEDNEDRLVLNNDGRNWTGDQITSWVGGWMSWRTDDWMITNYSLLTEPLRAPLTPYLGGTVKPYKCPADRFLAPEQRALGWTERARSVSMNAYMGDAQFPHPGKTTTTLRSSPMRLYRRMSDMLNRSPASVFVILDEHPDSIEDGLFLLGFPDNNPVLTWWGPNLPASQHSGACTFVFADTHAEIKRWVVSSTKRPVECTPWQDRIESAQQQGRQDLEWLFERMSERK